MRLFWHKNYSQKYSSSLFPTFPPSIKRLVIDIMQLLRIFFICLLPAIQFGQEVIPYPDNSPYAKDFEAMGIPSLSKIWDEMDYQKTFDILDQIYEADKFSLPRSESAYSADLFKRLTALENFEWLADEKKNIGNRIIGFERLKEVPFRTLIYYIENLEEQERFGREVLECLFLDLFVYQIGLELYTDLEISLGDRAQLGNFQQGFQRLQLEFNQKIGMTLKVFEEDYTRYAERDLLTFANKLYFLLPKISNPTYRKQLKSRLKMMENADFCPNLLQIIKEMRQQL